MDTNYILNDTYEIQEQIGAGGGGIIYKAWHKRLKKAVVLKKIYYSSSHNEEEKEILKNLKHSCLPQVFDFLDTEDGVFTVMDYIPGESFEKSLHDGKHFSQKQVTKYAIQLCEVVDYLHKQNPPIIHGDIKPANIMLTPEDNICLIDFNISGVLDGKSMVAQGYTPGYASPEQKAAVLAAKETVTKNFEKERTYGENKREEILSDEERTRRQSDEDTDIITQFGESEEDSEKTLLLNEEIGLRQGFVSDKYLDGGAKEGHLCKSDSRRTPDDLQRIDVRSDIYSIAATLYHLLTGVKPDSDPTKIKRPSEIDDKIGEGISIILMKALSSNPKARFQTTEAMLHAFRELYRYESKYKRLILRQELIFLALSACIGIGVMMTFFGQQEITAESEEAYTQVIALLGEAIEQQNEQEVDELYEQACRMKPERLDAYFQRTYYLYLQRDYAICQKYIEDTILSEAEWTDDIRMADIYYLLANCHFEQKNYEQAVVDYRTAIQRNDKVPDYYRDYVIALVRLNRAEDAEVVLKEAQEKGISSTTLLLAEGELKNARADYAGAESVLKQCISETDDDYIRLRAYVTCDMVYRNLYDLEQNGNRANSREPQVSSEEYLQKSKLLLEEARTKVGLENQLLIYERLAQTYIDLNELTGERTYGVQAISVLQDVIAHGWGSYITYNNIAILNQKMNELDEAESVLKQMLELYPGNYNTLKRLAFLEVEKQNQKENKLRDYEDFFKYYEESKRLYNESPSAQGDTEMQLLGEMYKQINEGGWLKD